MFEQPIPTLRRDGEVVHVLDQTLLPFRTETVALRTLAEAAHAIRSMQVRGAPLIGATAAFGVALALADEDEDVLTLRIQKNNPSVGSKGWEDNFKKKFREICTVRIDEIQYVEAGTITADQKLIRDDRQW